jgi:hypothetical protein
MGYCNNHGQFAGDHCPRCCDGVCWRGPSRILHTRTFTVGFDTIARVRCEAFAEQCLPRREFEGGEPVPVRLVPVEER